MMKVCKELICEYIWEYFREDYTSVYEEILIEFVIMHPDIFYEIIREIEENTLLISHLIKFCCWQLEVEESLWKDRSYLEKAGALYGFYESGQKNLIEKYFLTDDNIRVRELAQELLDAD